MVNSRKIRRLKSRLWKHHLPLGAGSLLAAYLVNSMIHSDYAIHRWSMATGYVGLTFLAITLILGPAKLLFGKRYPKSNDLRRDFGIWSAIVGLIHVLVGIQVHMGNPWLYFFLKDPFPKQLLLRGDLFGFANYTGLVASLILLLLLLLSNDLSMKKLGGKRWKNLQRCSYGIFLFVIAHSIAYQVIEDRKLLYLIFFSFLALATVVFQLMGFSGWRSKKKTASKEKIKV